LIILAIPYGLFMPRLAFSAMIDAFGRIFKFEDFLSRHEFIVHLSCTFSLLAVTTILAIFITNLGSVYTLTGGVSGVYLSMLVPSIMGFLTFRHRRRKVYCLCIFVIAILSIISTLLVVFVI